MQQTEFTDEYGRRVIRREWRNTEGELHRTAGPAMEEWTVLPDGAHVLSYQAWFLNGVEHREGRPACRQWRVAVDGTRVLLWEEWCRHGMQHRSTGPSYREWTVGPDGTRTLELEDWWVNGKLHRVDGPAYEGHEVYWHGVEARQEDLPWLRRGHGLLAGLTRATQQSGSSGVSPAWSRDARVAMTGADSASNTLGTYRSAVGGSVLLCM